ncbi:MAG TPA: ABC-2 family transporter protein [Bacilli bacterium]
MCLFIIFIGEFFFPIVTILIYSAGVSFPGWSLYEVLLIQSVFSLSRGIGFPLFTGMFFNVMRQVVSGTLDVLLLKPRPLIFIVIITAFNALDTSKIVAGTLLFSYIIIQLPSPDLLHWVEFFLLFILSISLIFSFFLLMSVYTIRFVGSDRVLGLIEPISQFGLYPNHIFNWPIRILANNVIPVALIGYFPAAVLLGKDLQGILIGIITAIAFIAASLLLWSKSINKYTSAGG